MITLALILAASPIPEQLGPAWGTFSRDPQLRRKKETVEVGTLGPNPSTKQLDYWMRYTVVTSQGTQISWADSQTCPAVRPTIEAMQSIRIPAIFTPEARGRDSITLDGTIYRLAAPSIDGRIEFDGNFGSSLGAFVDASLISLEKCWSDRLPIRWGPKASSKAS
jgi:hypothetical protein